MEVKEERVRFFHCGPLLPKQRLRFLLVWGFNVVGTNTDFALWTLTVLYAVVPIILKIIAIGLMWKFKLDRPYQEFIQKELQKL